MLQVEGPLRLRRILASVRALAAEAGACPGAAIGGADASPLARAQQVLAAVLAEADAPPAASGPHPAVDPGAALDLNAIPPPFARPAPPPAAHAGSVAAAPMELAEGGAAGAVPGGRAEPPDMAQPTAMHVDNEQDDDEEVGHDPDSLCCWALFVPTGFCAATRYLRGWACPLQRQLPHPVRMQAGCGL